MLGVQSPVLLGFVQKRTAENPQCLVRIFASYYQFRFSPGPVVPSPEQPCCIRHEQGKDDRVRYHEMSSPHFFTYSPSRMANPRAMVLMRSLEMAPHRHSSSSVSSTALYPAISTSITCSVVYVIILSLPTRQLFRVALRRWPR